MLKNLLTLTATTLILMSPAFAAGNETQGDTRGSSTTYETNAGAPDSWRGDIGNSFYTDDTMRELRSENEIRSNWNNLSDEQQAEVRRDCAEQRANRGLSGEPAADASSPGIGTGAGTATDSRVSEPGSDEMGAGATSGNQSMATLCTMIGDF